MIQIEVQKYDEEKQAEYLIVDYLESKVIQTKMLFAENLIKLCNQGISKEVGGEGHNSSAEL